MEGESGGEGKGQDRIPVYRDEGSPLEKLPGVPDPSPRSEDHRLQREVDAGSLAGPSRHALLNELRVRVKVQDERLDPRPPEELHVVGAQGPAEDRDDRLGQLIGERAQARPQACGEDHPPHDIASEAAFPARSFRIGRSFRASGFIRGLRSKFEERWAAVGGMKRR